MFSLPGLAPVRRAVARTLEATFSTNRFPQERYDWPPGDHGLFGPESVTWKVHADPAMIVGGMAALLLQALHPLAMAGVAEHSDFRHRPFQRLSRTASFVAATTYGSTDVAESVIEVVKAVHVRVRGVAPDGRPYAASDPDLVRWIHVAETASFMRAHRRYNPNPVRGRDVDAYFAEMAVIAERLGAPDVPRNRAEIRAYLRDVRPQLEAGPQAREALHFLTAPVGRDALTRQISQVLTSAAIGLQSPWVRDMYDLPRLNAMEMTTARPATFAIFGFLRLMNGTPMILRAARERCAAEAPRQPVGNRIASSG